MGLMLTLAIAVSFLIPFGVFLILIVYGIFRGIVSSSSDEPKKVKVNINKVEYDEISKAYFWFLIISISFFLGHISTLLFYCFDSLTYTPHDINEYQETIKTLGFFSILWGAASCAAVIANLSARHKYKKDHPNYREKHFFDLCVKEGFSSAETQADIARIRLIAEKHEISVPERDDELAAFFRRGQGVAISEEKAAEEGEKRKAFSEQCAKEADLRSELDFFAQFSGKNKRKAMLQKIIEGCRESISNVKSGSSGSPFLKEQSWGLAGGIASGIAGPAAGVAAAVDTIAQNQQIREYNKNVAQFLALAQAQGISTGYSSGTDTIKFYENKIKDYEKQLNATSLKLTDEKVDPNDLFRHMTFSNENVQVTETGAAKVSVEVISDQLYIYGDVFAVIDGFITAEIKKDGKTVGTAKLCLPLWGITDSKQTLRGICTDLSDPTACYTVQFVCGNLWLIEA